MKGPAGVTEIGSINSGWVPLGSTGVFFVKVGDNRWLQVEVENIYAPDTVKKLKFVMDKTGTSVINKNYILTLASEFGVATREVTDANIVNYLSQGESGNMGSGSRPEGDYLVDGGSVVVNGMRYPVGSDVYHGGFKFKVASSDGEAYLAHPSGGSISESPIVATEEMVSKVDYTKSVNNATPTYSSVFARFDNPTDRKSNEKATIFQSADIRRELRASQTSTLRYWECFQFHSGISTESKLETEITDWWSSETILRS